MAGTLKPTGVRAEVVYTHNDSNLYGSAPHSHLIDASASTYGEWFPIGTYVDVTINEPVNIWVMPYTGADGGGTYDADLSVHKWNGTSFVDTGKKLKSVNDRTSYWYLGLSGLTPGRYKFIAEVNYVIFWEWYFEEAYESKFLVVDGGNTKSYINGAWETVAVSPSPTEQQFITKGMIDLNVVPKSAWDLLAEGYELLYYTDDLGRTSTTFKLDVVPFKPIMRLQNKVRAAYWTNAPEPHPTQLSIEGVTKIPIRYRVDVSGYTKHTTAISTNNAIPAMTSATAPSGLASASTTLTNFDAWRAFDGNVLSATSCWATPQLVGWLQYKFPSAKVIQKYRINSQYTDDVTRAPKDWVFEGSNNGVDFTPLDSRTGITGWLNDGTFKEFMVSNEVAYQYYRLNVTANNGNASYLVVGSLEMYEMITTPLDLVTSTLKDWTTSYESVDESVILDDSYITTVNPYTIKVTAVNDATGYSTNKSGTITLYDTEPTLIATMTGMKLDLQIGDAENDLVRFRIVLNGNQIYPVDISNEFTDLEQSPISFNRMLKSNEVTVGSTNSLVIIAQDQFSKESTVTLNFVGEYSGIMFADEQGQFYSDDLGNILQYLEVDILVAGQISNTYPVRLINRTGYRITNIELWKDRKTLPPSASVEISETSLPFNPTDLLVIDTSLDYNEEVTFYVRVVTQINGQPGQGEFDVLVKADPS